MTVTFWSPRRVWRHTCSSTPITRTPSNRPDPRSAPAGFRPAPRCWRYTMRPRVLRLPGLRSSVGTQWLPSPTAYRGATARSAAQQRHYCPSARHDGSRRTGAADPHNKDGGRHPNDSWASVLVTVSRTALPRHTVGTIDPRRRPDTEARPVRSQVSGSPLTRDHQGGRTWSDQGKRRQRQARRGLPTGHRENSHHRKTATPTRATTRRPPLHPQLRRARKDYEFGP